MLHKSCICWGVGGCPNYSCLSGEMQMCYRSSLHDVCLGPQRLLVVPWWFNCKCTLCNFEESKLLRDTLRCRLRLSYRIMVYASLSTFLLKEAKSINFSSGSYPCPSSVLLDLNALGSNPIDIPLASPLWLPVTWKKMCRFLLSDSISLADCEEDGHKQKMCCSQRAKLSVLTNILWMCVCALICVCEKLPLPPQRPPSLPGKYQKRALRGLKGESF